jgi:hypothetical protein
MANFHFQLGFFLHHVLVVHDRAPLKSTQVA